MADPTFDDYLRRLFHIESGGNPYAQTGSNRGLGQFGPAEERMYGITDANRHDPATQAAAVAAEYAKNHRVLTEVLGREPTFAEHYFTHQQGVAGGPAILTGDPTAPAWKTIRPYYKSDAVAQRAITGNIPSDSPLKRLDVNDISNAGFASMWADKFNRGLPGGGGTAPPVNIAAAPEQPNVLPGMPQGLMGGAPSSGVLNAPGAPTLTPPGAGSVAVASAVGTPAIGKAPADVTADAEKRAALAQKALTSEKETEGEKNSKMMMALAQQLLAGSQAKPVQFGQMASVDTGPFRALPLNLPPGFGTGRSG